MALEQIPQYSGGKSITDSSARGWMGRHRGLIFFFIGILLLLDIAVAAYLLGFGSKPIGGLDGCLFTAGGQPVVGVTVKVGNLATTTYPDGCFFFAELPAGPNELIVEDDSGGALLTRPVDIPKDEALALGEVTLP